MSICTVLALVLCNICQFPLETVVTWCYSIFGVLVRMTMLHTLKSPSSHRYVCDECRSAKENDEIYCLCRQPYDESR